MGYRRCTRETFFNASLFLQGLLTECVQFSRLPAPSKDGNMSVRAVHELSVGDILIFRKQFDEKLSVAEVESVRADRR
jgi:hypothetical protein